MRYEVMLTRETYETATIHVTANTPEEAEERALATAGEYGELIADKWETHDPECSEAYVADPDDIELVNDKT